MRTGKARTGLSARLACHRRWTAYGMSLPSHTRGGSRMRESRPYGSVRGACDETHVPTATIGGSSSRCFGGGAAAWPLEAARSEERRVGPEGSRGQEAYTAIAWGVGLRH